LNSEHARRVYDFQEIKRLVPLTAVLERYDILSGLKRSGAQLAGVCPIHHRRNRKQFVVDPQKNLWRCFGDCDRGGSTIELVSAIEGIEIRAAAELIASWFAIASLSRNRRPHQQRRKRVSGKPSHKAFVVEDRGEGDDADAFWTRIGSAWPHKDGKGINIVLSALPANGRLVLREFTDEDAKKEEEDKKAKASTTKRR
jgi:hypothetical protein